MNLMTVWDNINAYRAAEWVEMTGLPEQIYWDLLNFSLAITGSYIGSTVLSLSSTL